VRVLTLICGELSLTSWTRTITDVWAGSESGPPEHHWNSLELSGTLWNSLEHSRTLRKSSDTLWNTAKLSWSFWNSVELSETFWKWVRSSVTGRYRQQVHRASLHQTDHRRKITKNKKVELSQRWPRDAPYILIYGALKIFESPWVRPRLHFCRNF